MTVCSKVWVLKNVLRTFFFANFPLKISSPNFSKTCFSFRSKLGFCAQSIRLSSNKQGTRIPLFCLNPTLVVVCQKCFIALLSKHFFRLLLIQKVSQGTLALLPSLSVLPNCQSLCFATFQVAMHPLKLLFSNTAKATIQLWTSWITTLLRAVKSCQPNLWLFLCSQLYTLIETSLEPLIAPCPITRYREVFAISIRQIRGV